MLSQQHYLGYSRYKKTVLKSASCSLKITVPECNLINYNMKIIIVLAVIAIAAAESEYYTYENLDMNKLINNKNELSEFTQCLLEEIPCNMVFESYRARTAEAVQKSCKKCNPQVKQMFWQYLQALKINLPTEYSEFRQKYDPDNQYFDALETELEKYSHE